MLSAAGRYYIFFTHSFLENVMIGYTTLGTNNLPRAVEFYDQLFGSIGIGRFMEAENYFVAWAPAPDAPSVAVTVPFNKEPATVGNGVMVALYMESQQQVDDFHKKALELGATNEGNPGFRPESNSSGFYAGYFRDLDGNKLNTFCIVPEK
jgi:catechol 2,3-dioxygenase-like lactoylglutathione lyase family enzyme